MWGILALILAIVGIITVIANIDGSLLGLFIGLILCLGGTTFCLVMDYCYTKHTYNVETETQKIIIINGEEKAIRLRIYKNNIYYDIELPIEKYNGETKLSFTWSEISQLEYE